MKVRKTVYAIIQSHHERHYLESINEYYYSYHSEVKAAGSRQQIETLWNEIYCNVPGASIGRKRFFVEKGESPESIAKRIGVEGYCLLAGNHC